MAAGLGFKDFQTGEVLTAADVDGYLMQGVWVFASATARDAAVTSPQEGNFAYLKDTNVTTYYTGSAWANLDTTGMTNPMTTTGDTIYSSSGSTPARLGIGTTGQVLTVAGGVPSWATPAGGGGKVLQVVQGTITSDVSTSSASYTDSGLTVSITPSSSASKVLVLASMPSAYIYSTGAASALRGGYILLRGATQLTETKFGWSAMSYSADNIFTSTQSVAYLDSPATTSSTTYKIQYKKISGSVVGLEGSATAIQSIVVLEIGA